MIHQKWSLIWARDTVAAGACTSLTGWIAFAADRRVVDDSFKVSFATRSSTVICAFKFERIALLAKNTSILGIELTIVIAGLTYLCTRLTRLRQVFKHGGVAFRTALFLNRW